MLFNATPRHPSGSGYIKTHKNCLTIRGGKRGDGDIRSRRLWSSPSRPSSFNHSSPRGSWHTQPLQPQRSSAPPLAGILCKLLFIYRPAVGAALPFHCRACDGTLAFQDEPTWPFLCENVHHSAGDSSSPLLVFHCAHCWHSPEVLYLKPLTFSFMSPLRCCAASALLIEPLRKTCFSLMQRRLTDFWFCSHFFFNPNKFHHIIADFWQDRVGLQKTAANFEMDFCLNILLTLGNSLLWMLLNKSLQKGRDCTFLSWILNEGSFCW